MTPLWTRCTDLTAARGAALALLLCLPAGESQAQARPPSPLAPLTPQTPPLIAPAQAPEFIGCYKDTSDLDLNGHLERSAQNTPLRCSAICQSRLQTK